ncbi:hypothetical protein FOZ60_017673 [Perkinsus olseni]|uniref:Uncharacterized protein n=1 Tax=Perkinsus olseni TaxID=32597 RepID=A0A7J6P609_PEROL|nr:hypothetical protein FOZ60_017673 [Perkinsus olseni]
MTPRSSKRRRVPRSIRKSFGGRDLLRLRAMPAVPVAVPLFSIDGLRPIRCCRDSRLRTHLGASCCWQLAGSRNPAGPSPLINSPQTHDPLAGIAQRLQSLSSQFDRINDHINDWIAKKLRGQTKADSNRCRLVFGEGRSTDIYFAEESASPNPIVGYVYRQDVPGQAAKRPSVYVTAA